jgi:hypothetical protein
MKWTGLSKHASTVLRRIPLVPKLLLLLFGAAVFVILFPFILTYGLPVYAALLSLLVCIGVLFRLVVGRRMFRVTLLLWAGGTMLYLLIAAVLILKDVQPLPYMRMSATQMLLYYFSYPLRILGIFFTGLIVASITSPAEFLQWGRVGLRLALLYRAFEYSVMSLDDVRRALMLQGEWPERGARRRFILLVKGAPVLIATMFRNIILWFPWAWICYTNLEEELTERGIR